LTSPKTCHEYPVEIPIVRITPCTPSMDAGQFNPDGWTTAPASTVTECCRENRSPNPGGRFFDVMVVNTIDVVI
jgi:hypothetical protein